VREGAAELVVPDLADEGRARAERGDADDGVGGGTARTFGRRPHGLIDAGCARLVDQRHAALVHALRHQEIVLGAGDDVDNGIADAEHIVAGSGHVGAFRSLRAHYIGRARLGKRGAARR
jgi:hypothetical protein